MSLKGRKWKWDTKLGKIVEITEGEPQVEVHAVIQDTIDAQVSHADGKVYESRSAMKRAAKDAGAVEVSFSDVQRRRSIHFEPDGRAIHEAIERAEVELRDNRVKAPETPAHVREQWERMQRG